MGRPVFSIVLTNLIIGSLCLSFGTTNVVGQTEELYDTLYIFDNNLVDGGVGNAIGGAEAFPSLGTIDSQVVDDFRIDRDYAITRVVRDMMSYFGTEPAEGIWVQFYADNRGRPSEDVYAEYVVSPGDFTSIDLGQVAGFQGWRFDMDLSTSDIRLPEGTWWIDTQPLDINTSGDWFWSMRSISTLIDWPTHVRDGWQEHGNNYYGLWGTPDWEELDFRGNGSLSMRIEGEPAMAGCLLLSFDQLVAGQTTLFQIDLGTPGARGVLVYGLQPGETVINGLSGYCATFGIKGVNQKRVIGGLNNTFDSRGSIAIKQFIPGAARGATVYLQAAEQGTCPDECISNLVKETVQ